MFHRTICLPQAPVYAYVTNPVSGDSNWSKACNHVIEIEIKVIMCQFLQRRLFSSLSLINLWLLLIHGLEMVKTNSAMYQKETWLRSSRSGHERIKSWIVFNSAFVPPGVGGVWWPRRPHRVLRAVVRPLQEAGPCLRRAGWQGGTQQAWDGWGSDMKSLEYGTVIFHRCCTSQSLKLFLLSPHSPSIPSITL